MDWIKDIYMKENEDKIKRLQRQYTLSTDTKEKLLIQNKIEKVKEDMAAIGLVSSITK